MLGFLRLVIQMILSQNSAIHDQEAITSGEVIEHHAPVGDLGVSLERCEVGAR